MLNIARETGCHIMLVHHMSKIDRDDGDQILGSTALFAAVDSGLFMRKRDQFRTLMSLQRYGTDLEGLALSLDEETGNSAELVQSRKPETPAPSKRFEGIYVHGRERRPKRKFSKRFVADLRSSNARCAAGASGELSLRLAPGLRATRISTGLLGENAGTRIRIL